MGPALKLLLAYCCCQKYTRRDVRKYWCCSSSTVLYSMVSLHWCCTKSKKERKRERPRPTSSPLVCSCVGSIAATTVKSEGEEMFDLFLCTVWKVICDSNVPGRRRNEERREAKGREQITVMWWGGGVVVIRRQRKLFLQGDTSCFGDFKTLI